MRTHVPAEIAAMLPFPLFSSAAETTSSIDIFRTAQSLARLATLIAAFEVAGLRNTLEGAGPFTVFAPTDAAFAKLPNGMLEVLLKPENRAKLLGVLSYHVVAGLVKAENVMTMASAKTLNGQAVTLSLSGRTFKINDAAVVQPDVAASNGIIHIIDAVLAPVNK